MIHSIIISFPNSFDFFHSWLHGQGI